MTITKDLPWHSASAQFSSPSKTLARRKRPDRVIDRQKLLQRHMTGPSCYVSPVKLAEACDQGVQANMAVRSSFAEIFAAKRLIINKNHFQYESVKRCITSHAKSQKGDRPQQVLLRQVGNVGVQSSLVNNAFPPIILNSKRA